MKRMFQPKTRIPAGKLSLDEPDDRPVSPTKRGGINGSSSSSKSKSKNDKNNNSLSSKERLKTHIEVCARIRPLEISTDNIGFFSSAKPSSSSSTSSSSRSSPKKSLLSGFRKKNSRDGEYVAWDVSAEGDTAAQSEKTKLIKGRTHTYTLDNVYGTQATTRQLYDNSIHSLVKSAMEGYHSSVLAYGQTSTGKTFTMSGTKDEPGLIPLCIKDCFRYVTEVQESREYLIRVSYLEVYKEHIRDLLASKPEPVRLFDGPNGLIIRGLKEEVVSTPAQVFALLKKGESRRQVGATHMNQHSSRSHVVVRLWIESTTDGNATRISSLSLVDLAGSESVRLNGLDRREEGHFINKSLMTLGQIVLALSEGKTGHMPYRDSKLTRILQPSLSGNAQMVMLCCISPQVSHMEESHNTFKFAIRAKKIKQKAMINVADEDDSTLLQIYRDEIEDLRKQLAEAKEQQKLLLQQQKENAAAMAESLSPSLNPDIVDDGEIRELVEAIKTMERLILKSRPHTTTTTTELPVVSSPEVSFEHRESDKLLLEDDNDSDMGVLGTDAGNVVATPARDDDEALNVELGRIRGLLGTVLKKKGISEEDPHVRKTLDYSSTPRTPENDREVEELRHQLEEQEMATTLRKADASFLQSQLREKDLLLEEVSNVLEAIELRQAELERENAALRAELHTLKAKIAA